MLATVAVAQLINLFILATLAPEPPRAVNLMLLARAIETRDEKALQFGTIPYRPEFDRNDGPAAPELAARLAGELGMLPAEVVIDLGRVHNGKMVEEFVVSAPGEAAVRQPVLLGAFQVAVRQGTRGWLLVEPRDRSLFDNRERRFLLLFLLSSLAMLPSAWAFARLLAQPFEQFVDAAERLGRDPSATPPAIDGPEEVGRAAQALRLMQQRLQAYVSDRTQMLGAIAHDLRTPLTRLAFRVEALDPPLRESLVRDIAEMNAMIGATMELARGEAQPSVRQRLELGSLVEQVADDMALIGRPVSAAAEGTMIVDGDPVGLKRLFANLMDNGVHYGGTVHARAWRDGDNAIVDVEDEGPGLPAGQEERVFDPFYRLEPSRSRDTGGIGLGLAVVRSTARAHGGDVILSNRPTGGLRARVTLPLAHNR